MPLACLTGAPLCSRDPVGAKTIIVDAVQRDPAASSASSSRSFIPPPTAATASAKKASSARKKPPCGRSACMAVRPRWKTICSRTALPSCFRLATVFGVSPRMRTDLLVNDFVLRAVRDRYIMLFEADFKRNYLHVRDAADVFAYCLENFGRMKDQPYNVGLSDANLSKRELCSKIQRQIPELCFSESAVGQDPGQARLHRLECQDRSGRLQGRPWPAGGHRGTREGLPDPAQQSLRQRLRP